jgi:hypothetical protein
MFLEARGLPPLSVHEGHFFGKRTATVFALKAARYEMQKRLLAPHIEVADAPMLFLVDCRGKGATVSAQGNLFTMGAPKMENFVLSFPPDCVHLHHQRRNAQQLGQRLIGNLFEVCLANSLHGSGGVLYEWNDVGQQFHGKTSQLGLSHPYLCLLARKVPQKVNPQPLFTLICDEPEFIAALLDLFAFGGDVEIHYGWTTTFP